MEYWLIFGAMLVALAPLQYFWPTKRQRCLAHIREQAAIMGLFVELRKLPDHRLIRLSIPENQQADWVFYGLRLSPKAEVTVGTWIRIDHEWTSMTAEASPLSHCSLFHRAVTWCLFVLDALVFTGRRTSPMNNY